MEDCPAHIFEFVVQEDVLDHSSRECVVAEEYEVRKIYVDIKREHALKCSLAYVFDALWNVDFHARIPGAAEAESANTLEGFRERYFFESSCVGRRTVNVGWTALI